MKKLSCKSMIVSSLSRRNAMSGGVGNVSE